ncbi:MAG: PQQ-binding-like beta-propeller repeat protein [Thermoplasmata archaeon]
MRGQIRSAEIWVVVVIAVMVWASAGVLGLEAGHALSRGAVHNLPSVDRKLGAILLSENEVSSPSASPRLDPAAAQVYAGELTSPNAQLNGFFGSSVAISGTTVVVGAWGESVSGQNNAGHAYTFNARTGALVATLTSPNAQTGGLFGRSVAITGTTVVVGAPQETVSGQGDAGHVYTFNAKTGALILTLTSPDAQLNGFFGSSVAISGKTVVVGAYGEMVSGQTDAGHVYTFNAKTGALVLTLTSPGTQSYGIFGGSVAIGGTTVLVGADGETVSSLSGAGHAYTFNAKTGALILTLTSPNPQLNGYFGYSVAIGGTTLVVGAADETLSGGLIAAGHAYTFNAKTGAPISTLASPNAQVDGAFGGLVTISGRTVVVGAYGEAFSGLSQSGHAYTFNAKTGGLILTLTSPNAQTSGVFGSSVAMSGKTVVIGADFESALGQSGGGHVYLW